MGQKPKDRGGRSAELMAAIRRMREDRGWSQARLAAAAGVNAKSLDHWEKLERVPSVNEVLALGDALGLSPEALMRKLSD